jgi:hypothetical protein
VCTPVDLQIVWQHSVAYSYIFLWNLGFWKLCWNWKGYLRFCKNILKVRQMTSNYMVYGEIGRYPLNIHINVRMIGFLLMLKSSNKLSSNVYQLLFTLKESKDFHFKWLDHIFRICNSIGMNYVLDSKELESSHQCIKLQIKRI